MIARPDRLQKTQRDELLIRLSKYRNSGAAVEAAMAERRQQGWRVRQVLIQHLGKYVALKGEVVEFQFIGGSVAPFPDRPKELPAAYYQIGITGTYDFGRGERSIDVVQLRPDPEANPDNVEFYVSPLETLSVINSSRALRAITQS